MAYFLKQNEDNNQNNQNQQPQNVGGNIYSTSGGEVSSQIENNSNSSNSSNSNSSSSSGNWVNLNSYLDANQNKAGRYANTFVESDLNKGQDYKNNLQNAQDQYLSSIKSDNAYTYNGNDNNILNKYLKDSSSVSQNEKDRTVGIIKGYQGDDYFQNTGDKYGYNDLKKNSDDFNNLSKNILNENYLKSQMGNNVSTGGKNLNSFILGGSNDSRNVLNNASNQFSELSSLLDSANNTLNNERDNVVNTANKNSSDFNKVLNNKKSEIENSLRSIYNDSKNINDRVLAQKSNPKSLLDLPTGSSTKEGYYNYYKDLSREATNNLNKELQELNNRYNYLLGLSPLNNDSRVDYNLNSYEWLAPNEAQKQEQDFRSKVFDTLLLDRTLTPAVPPEALAALKRAYMVDDINADELKSILYDYKKKYYNY